MFFTVQTPREIHRVKQRRGREEIEVTWGRKGRRETEVTKRRRGGIKTGESNLASNQFPKCSPHPGTAKEIHRFGYQRESGGRR